MENKAKQVVLSSILGDGYLSISSSCTNSKLKTSSVHLEYIRLKESMLEEYAPLVRTVNNKGYTQGKGVIHTLTTRVHPDLTGLMQLSLFQILQSLDYLGLALWFADDVSYNKRYHFYNLCTHAFSYSENKVISEFLNRKLRIRSVVAIERKKDGREFWYIRVPKLQGAHIVSSMLRENLALNCFNYKLMDKELESELYKDWVRAFGVSLKSYEEAYKNVLSIRKSRNALKGYQNKFGN